MTSPLVARGFALVAVLAVSTAGVDAQVTLQLLKTLDGFNLSVGNPTSVAAYGDRLYVGTREATPRLSQINDPLGTAVNAGELQGLDGLLAAGNGYVNLDTDGTTLVAATNNSGAADLVEVYDVATGALRYEANPAGLPTYSNGTQPTRIDGASIDPITGNVWLTAFASGRPIILDPDSITDNSDDPSILFGGSPTGTGWRDLNFGPTGDLYLRGTNGVLGGVRNGTTVDDFTTINSLGATAGFSQVAGGFNAVLQDSSQSAINIEVLPASFTGTEDLFIANTRVGQPDLTPFADQVLAFEADAGFDGLDPFSLDERGVLAPINFLAADGFSAFTTPGSDTGIYDFSFDPVNEVLYVADEANGAIYVFGEPVGPSGVDGDYNNNGVADAADYTVWRDNLGQPVELPNDITPGTVDAGDLTVWQNNYGATASAVAVPEPSTAAILGLGLLAGLARRV